MTATFHLHNRDSERELEVKNNGKILSFCPVSIYLGVKLDRALTYRHHLKALRKKLSRRLSLLRRLAGSGWGTGAKTLHTAALSLIYSTAEYCAPAWCRSSHTRLIDSVLNDALRIVTGAYVPLRRTTFQFSHASSQLNFAAKERHSSWLIAVLWTLATFCMAS